MMFTVRQNCELKRQILSNIEKSPQTRIFSTTFSNHEPQYSTMISVYVPYISQNKYLELDARSCGISCWCTKISCQMTVFVRYKRVQQVLNAKLLLLFSICLAVHSVANENVHVRLRIMLQKFY